jgi:squalene-hopene/tetraprenyl-beta-curcumene cyclase
MSGSRRWFLFTAGSAAAAWLAGCGCWSSKTLRPDADQVRELDHALRRAAEFLIEAQSSDGSWRSDLYGPFKDGASLTPLVLRTLLVLPPARESVGCYRKGVEYLAALVKGDGSIDVGSHGLSYPVYSASAAVQVLSQPCNARHGKARDAWLSYLRERQLTERLGWQPADKPYGGWGYCPLLPRKPGAGEPLHPLTESNLSATVFALEALRAAGASAEDEAFGRALTFVRRCQNFSDDPKARDEKYDDGGFYFIYDDPVRNKAGVAGKDRSGKERYHSYGSTTADGWRALLLCGCRAHDQRVAAARSWMERSFRADSHPGNYREEREVNRAAVYYYYCCSVSQTLVQAGIRGLKTPERREPWEELLAGELLQRQEKNGSWENPVVPQREDEPLVATSLAALALVHCQTSITGNPPAPIVDP